MTTSDPSGGIDPLRAALITGWASAGAAVELVSADGVVLAAAVCASARVFVRSDAADRAGFALAVPQGLLDGQPHKVRVVSADGEDLPGSPLVYQHNLAVSGKVDEVVDNVIRGYVRAANDASPIAVAAIVGNETVALGVARKSQDGGHRFALALPVDVLRAGHRLVHVCVVGASDYLDGSPAALPRPMIRPATVQKRERPTTLAIKISAPNIRVAHEWGDYHFAQHLVAALQRRGWVARVDCQDEWTRGGDDVTLTLRGRHRYTVVPDTINLMWQISHPDRMQHEETLDYNHIFVASDIHARALALATPTPVSSLHQATAPAVFHPPKTPISLGDTVLFVGNSRSEYRAFVRWCVESDIDVAVFGSLWDELIPKKHIRGTYISNDDVHRWYGSCGILLNDHWDTMRDNGFLSNRLFDGSASGAFLITDPVRGLAEIFGDSIETANDAAELSEKIKYFLAHPEERAKRVAKARQIVLGSHTFDHRADTIISTVQKLKGARTSMET